MTWVEHIAHTREVRNAFKVTVAKPEGKRILEQILEKLDRKVWTGFIWFRIGKPMEGSCEHGNGPLGFIKCGELLD
jgi:hypothetical protein